MELDGKIARPDCDYERYLLGVEGDIEITPELDAYGLLSTVNARRVALEERKAADDDQLTHDQRAAIPAEELALSNDERYARRAVDTIVERQFEMYPDLIETSIRQ